MKKYGKSVIRGLIVLVFVVTCVIFIKTVLAEPLETFHASWVRVKDSAAEDGATFAATAAFDANGGDFGNMFTDYYQVTSRGNPRQPYTASAGGAWQFAFYGTDAANETFSFTVVGWAKGNGMAQVICEGDGVLGAMTIGTEPNGDAITTGLWADTINLDETTKWPSVGVYNASGDDECAILCIDLTGLEYISFVTYDVAGGSEASTIGVYGRLY